ncbi:hypothetical protein [Bacillus altitudinis]|uniref:hypothetical protein n=1 Tax=Bacillus altitudinis TaxID=293387 RepID=UPI00227DE608|nr:hypothetical protein [Bacillus altitudinis]MCY7439415.1 hypothetical protein [Bacillus altitudinis]MEC1142453.1 hypothetical protein [Bacillus altitudinis]
MTEEKRIIHVLKDEKLGVDREYVAVDREAEAGEKIVITECLYDVGEFYGVGHYGKIVTSSREYDDHVDFNGFNNSFVYRGGRWSVGSNNDSAYHVLEPTDIVHIDGERYRLEDRKADIGECVIYVNKENGKSDGIDTVVTSVSAGMVDVLEYKDDSGEDVCSICHGYYYVLAPVQDAAEPKESDVITVLANLGAEVAELKRAVARHQAEINALHEDKVRLGEQLAKVAADDPKALSLTADELAQIIVSLERAGR